MSLFKYLFDNEWSQRADIEELKMQARRQKWASINSDRRKAEEVDDLSFQVRDLQDQVGSLRLIVRGLVTLLKEQKTLDYPKFREILLKIDMEDGVQDGKASGPLPDSLADSLADSLETRDGSENG